MTEVTHPWFTVGLCFISVFHDLICVSHSYDTKNKLDVLTKVTKVKPQCMNQNSLIIQLLLNTAAGVVIQTCTAEQHR